MNLLVNTPLRRNIRSILPIAILILAVSLTTRSQTWRSKLYPKTWEPPLTADFYTDMLIQDYSYAGYHRGEREIPLRKGPLLDVTRSPYNADNTGNTDVTAILQRALNDAGKLPNGGIVYLPAGKYQVSAAPGGNQCLLINRSNVVLRGAGAGKTSIFNSSIAMRNKSILSVKGTASWDETGDNKTLIVKNLTHPTTVIPVQTISGFKVGDLIIVRNYIDNDWIDKHKMLGYWKDKGASLGGLIYCREIVAINPGTRELTIDIPTRYTLEMAHGACVYKLSGMLTETGVENLSIGNRQSFVAGDWKEESYTKPGNGPYDSHNSWAIGVSEVANGWIRDVASYSPDGNPSGAHILSNGIKVSETKNVSIVNCNFRKPQFGGGGGNGYMYRVMGNETLIRDCISDSSRHGFVMSGMNASGNVFYQCNDRNTAFQAGLSGNEKTSGSGSDHHMHFSHSNLFDKCVLTNSFFAAGWRKWGGAAIHGLTGAHSVYWNLTSNGSQADAVQTQQGRYGYVIGTLGNKPGVKTSAWMAGTEVITDPVDYVEGVGMGAGLDPQSLYMDQLKKRLNKQ